MVGFLSSPVIVPLRAFINLPLTDPARTAAITAMMPPNTRIISSRCSSPRPLPSPVNHEATPRGGCRASRRQRPCHRPTKSKEAR
ncbi:hypothetical protein SKAU_G00017470 [Synaphobranchus kaupii]|uniref:Uncharacterized protein n=1 Tax=Synaphobranchus kaupii TaxID=118154 RepID=A0A9Q1JE54_SYNKA|nr:hypothetical protein SKAU_G00017470 [Synaphobranchus kaupii]